MALFMIFFSYIRIVSKYSFSCCRRFLLTYRISTANDFFMFYKTTPIATSTFLFGRVARRHLVQQFQ